MIIPGDRLNGHRLEAAKNLVKREFQLANIAVQDCPMEDMTEPASAGPVLGKQAGKATNRPAGP
jgi:hypothetical protein